MKLAPVQLEAITRADGRRGFAYFMEMGLGKTLTVLVEFRVLQKCNAVQRLVVICPNSFKSGWADEIEKHGIDLLPLIYESGRFRDVGTAVDVLIINYEAVRTPRGQAAIIRFTAGYDCYLALDESVKLKNKSAKQTEAIIGKEHKRYPKLGLVEIFKVVRILSGKPMTQGPHDLWAQLKAINAMPMSYWGFRARSLPDGWLDGQAGDRHPQRGSPAADDQAGVLPGQEEGLAQGAAREGLHYPPLRAGAGAAEALRRDGRGLSSRTSQLARVEPTPLSVAVAIAKWEKCSQIQCGFAINDGETIKIVEPKDNPRLKLLQEILDEEVTGKVVIVYRHRMVGLMLAGASAAIRRCVAWIRGGMIASTPSITRSGVSIGLTAGSCCCRPRPASMATR